MFSEGRVYDYKSAAWGAEHKAKYFCQILQVETLREKLAENALATWHALPTFDSCKPWPKLELNWECPNVPIISEPKSCRVQASIIKSQWINYYKGIEKQW